MESRIQSMVLYSVVAGGLQDEGGRKGSGMRAGCRYARPVDNDHWQRMNGCVAFGVGRILHVI